MHAHMALECGTGTKPFSWLEASRSKLLELSYSFFEELISRHGTSPSIQKTTQVIKAVWTSEKHAAASSHFHLQQAKWFLQQAMEEASRCSIKAKAALGNATQELSYVQNLMEKAFDFPHYGLPVSDDELENCAVSVRLATSQADADIAASQAEKLYRNAVDSRTNIDLVWSALDICRMSAGDETMSKKKGKFLAMIKDMKLYFSQVDRQTKLPYEKMVEQELAAIQNAYNEGAHRLLAHVWSQHPANDTYKLPTPILAQDLALILRKSTILYHPDKHISLWNSGEVERRKKFVVFEHIATLLTAKYTVVKKAG